MRTRLSLLVALAALLLSSTVLAQEATVEAPTSTPPPPKEEPAPPPKEEPKGGLLAGAKVGGIASFGGLDPNVRVGVELGYVFSVLNRGIAVALDVDYSAPKSSGTQADARVPGGSYDWHLTQQILAFNPVVMYRMTSISPSLTPFVGVGPRIYLLESTVKGIAGSASIPETTEQSTKVGVGVPLGLELKLGPGALLGEILLEYGGLDHTATGSSNTGAASLLVGYRFLP